MERACNVSLAAALISYESEIGKLTVAYACQTCNEADRDSAIPKFCRVVIVETIMSLGLILSCLVADENLLPKVGAIESIYHTGKETHWLNFEPDQQHVLYLDTLGPFGYIVSTESISTGDSLVGGCVQLFTGQPYEGLIHIARSTQGICALMGALSDSKGPVDKLNRIYITTGSIEYDTKPFDYIADDYDVDRKIEQSALQHVMEYSSCTVSIKGARFKASHSVRGHWG